MKRFLLLVVLFASTFSTHSQITQRGYFFRYKLYSQNGEYYLQSVPYDDFTQSVYGLSQVFRTGNPEPLYTIERDFTYEGFPNKISLSNDGTHVMYINDFFNDPSIPERRVMTFYSQGQLIKSYTLSDLLACDDDLRDCTLLYFNKEVIDRDSSRWYGQQYKYGTKEGTAEAERFAHRFNVFTHNDTVYLIDINREVKSFEMSTGELLAVTDFGSAYEKLKDLAHMNILITDYEFPTTSIEFPPLTNGEALEIALANHLNMKVHKSWNGDYKGYLLSIDAFVDQNGKLEILELSCRDSLPFQKIRDFLEEQILRTEVLPSGIRKWRFNQIMSYRNSSDQKAKAEREEEIRKWQEDYAQEIVADSLNGYYIPKNVKECFEELDRMLRTKDRLRIKNLGPAPYVDVFDPIATMIRGRWSLWGRSRLYIYLEKRYLMMAEDNSTLIIRYYHAWLNGDQDAWKKFEAEFPVRKH